MQQTALAFFLGFAAGIAFSALVFAVLSFLRSPIERALSAAGKQIQLAGPRPRGFVMEPPDEPQESRDRIVERNKAQGRDTRAEELE